MAASPVSREASLVKVVLVLAVLLVLTVIAAVTAGGMAGPSAQRAGGAGRSSDDRRTDHRPRRGGARFRGELQRIEEALRAGAGIAFWMYVEGENSDRTDPGEHARHKAILADFDRLARLEGLSFADMDVDARGDDAIVRFRVASRNPGRPPAPVRAELTFPSPSRGLAAREQPVVREVVRRGSKTSERKERSRGQPARLQGGGRVRVPTRSRCCGAKSVRWSARIGWPSTSSTAG